MSATLDFDPRTVPASEVPLPRTAMLHRLRPAASRLLRWWFDVEVDGADQLPASGPIVLAANHVGFLDGPLLAIIGPRPVHALTKTEMFQGPMGAFLSGAGQIPLDRFGTDLNAIRTSLAVLRSGGAVGVFPEGTRGAGLVSETRPGAAYLAVVTGAPVVPVSFLGTRQPGGSDNSVPPRGSRMVMTIGAPVAFDTTPWPRTPEVLAEAERRVDQAIRDTAAYAEKRTGLRLPGPIEGTKTGRT